MQYKRLGKTDLTLSTLGYGASPLGNAFRDIDDTIGIRTVHRALDQGINYIDCSPYYGLTKAETVLGKALKGIARDRYVLSSKAGRYGADFADFDMSPQRLRQSLDESCTRLGVDELDIFFLHDIEFVDLDYVLNESLPCLDALKQAGRIRYFGVTGYPLTIFERIIEHFPIDCILSYCRYALHDTSLTQLLPKLKEKQIGVINASPTAMGLLTQRGAPDWHPASAELVACCQQVERLCSQRGVDITQIAMAFAAQHADISSTLVGTATPENIDNNIRWSQAELDKELLQEIQSLFSECQQTVWPSGLPLNQSQ